MHATRGRIDHLADFIHNVSCIFIDQLLTLRLLEVDQ
jgi:hypothetical protein